MPTIYGNITNRSTQGYIQIQRDVNNDARCVEMQAGGTQLGGTLRTIQTTGYRWDIPQNTTQSSRASTAHKCVRNRKKKLFIILGKTKHNPL